MSARGILLVLLLGLLAGALWLVLGPGSGRGSKGIGGTSAPGPIEEQQAQLEPAKLPPESLAPPPDPASSRQEEPRLPEAATLGTTWTVQVERPDGARAAAVEVAYATPDATRAFRAAHKDVLPESFIDLARAAGRKGRTDASGKLVIPVLPEGSRLVAWDGPLLTFHNVVADEVSPILLRLDLDRSLEVRVVDERGLPQEGVPVRLRVDHGDGSSTVLPAETRGAEGLAIFLHVGVGWSLAAERCTATAAIAGIFEQPIERSFPFREWPAEPLELVLVAHGSVVVDVHDSDGQPLAKVQRDVELKIVHEQVAGALLWNERGTSSAEVEDGRARFEVVGLGLQLEAALDARPERNRASTSFAGPERPGEELEVELVCAAAPNELVFRVLDPAGAPLADQELGLTLIRRLAGGTLTQGDSRTSDGEGRLHLPLLESWSEGSTLTLELRCTRKEGEDLSAALDLSREFPPGISDLGDLVLSPAAVLVAGRIVEADGAPVPGPSVRVEKSYSQGPGVEPSWSTALWGNVEEDGSFAIHEQAPGPELRLVVDSSSHITPPPIPFVPGTRDLLITLERGGAIAGSIVAPEGVSGQAFWVRASCTVSAPKTSFVDPDGRFRVSGLLAGQVDCAFLLIAGNETVLEIPGVSVVDGETSRDPRLQEVELARRVRLLRIRVRLPDGKPAQSGWVRVLASESDQPGTNSQRSPAAFVIESGEARVLGRRVPLELELNVPGFRVLRLARVEADQEVVLEPAFSVRLELAAGVELPPPGASLQVQLQPTGEAAERAPSHLALYRGGENAGWWSPAFGDETNTFGAAREVLLPIQELGNYEVTFYVVFGSPDGGRMSFEVPASEATRSTSIGAGDAGKTFRVEPEQAAYGERLAGGR